MPELRKDPIVGRWVIIATDRAKRPRDFRVEPQPSRHAFCPFCAGNEERTPPEILAYREEDSDPNQPGWRVRVVPNKFPALRIEGDLNKFADGMYDLMNGIGAHEVIIETPEHVLSLTDLPEPQIREVLRAYRERLIDLRRDRRMAYGMIFKNVGHIAGASLDHTHSQLIVTPTVPITVQQEMDGADTFFRYRGRCIYCDMIQQEVSAGNRMVLESEHLVAFAPFAARFPFETWLMPKAHESHFEQTPPAVIDELARDLREVLMRIERALDRPAYNYMIHNAPFTNGRLESFHWHIEIIPRLTRVAGFEWGTGFYINPVAPESAAGFLRDIDIDDDAERRVETAAEAS